MVKNRPGNVNIEGNRKKISRMEFLNLTWIASLGVMVVSLGGITLVFNYPRFKEGDFGGIYKFGKVSELPEVGSSPVNIAKLKLWIVNTKIGLHALYKVCPHLGCLYSWNDQEIKFICPCHGSQFENDGDYISGPTPRSLDYFAIYIIDPKSGEELASNEDDGGPIRLPDSPDALVLIDTGKKFIGLKHT